MNGEVDKIKMSRNSILLNNSFIIKLTAYRAILKLKEKGIIERVGSDKSGYWKIKEQ